MVDTRVKVGHTVTYVHPVTRRPLDARVVTVVDSTHLNLWIGGKATGYAKNSVAKQTSRSQLNVWKPTT